VSIGRHAFLFLSTCYELLINKYRKVDYTSAMTSISRYMTRQILIVTFFATVAICFAMWMTQSLRLIELIVNRGLPTSMFLYLATLMLPRFLTLVVPVAVFGAILFTYHRLMNDNEIVVLRAAGASHFSLAAPGLVAAAILTLFTYSLSLFLVPASFRNFKDLQHKVRSDYSLVLLQEGVFNTLGDGITVYVRERNSNGELQGILVHDNRDLEAPVTYHAQHGALIHNENGPRVVLMNGNRQQVDRKNGQLSMLYFDRLPFDVGQVQLAEQVRWREPQERYLSELLVPDGSKNDRFYHDKLVAEGHFRLASPLLPLTFGVIAMSILLCAPYNRRGQMLHVLLAVTLTVILLVASFGLPHLVTKYPVLVPLLYANSIVPLIGGLYLLAKPLKRRGSAQAVPLT
jgi:lipopolysaccharide export system permease protein